MQEVKEGSRVKKEKPKSKAAPTIGDHMRITEGPFVGAEGTVQKIEHISRRVQIIEIIQLNGNPIRLPRRSFEFAGLKPKPRSLRGK